MNNLNTCSCGSGKPSFWLNDGYGIPLCKVCPTCKATKLKGYRSDIMSAYSASEPINEDGFADYADEGW